MNQPIRTALLVLLLGVSGADAAPKKPAAPSLTERGDQLAKRYADERSELKKQITEALAFVDDASKAKYLAVRKAEDTAAEAVAKAKAHTNDVEKTQGLIGHAKRYWIPKADKNIAAAQKRLAAAKTDAERAAARKDLEHWQKDRAAGVKALAQREAAHEQAKRDEAKRRTELEQAERAHAEAKAAAEAALKALRLTLFLDSDLLDGKLAKFIVLDEATPQGLAAFAQQSDKHEKLVDRLLADDALMIRMVAADGAKDGNYGRAMAIYRAIQDASAKSNAGVLQHLALAVCLEHATPIAQRNPESTPGAPKTVDPVERYLHFEKAYLDGELDPYFDRHGAWDLRFVVDGDEPNDTLAWGREMLRNYRPDHITTKDDRWRYVAIVRTDVRYGSQECDNDRTDLQFFQNILMNGGICGRRAFFGRFILRAFGVPTVPHPQKGHASLARWTPDGWVICLGANWGSGWAPGRYYDDRDFLAITQARATGEPYMRVKRAQWIGDAFGEPRKYGFHTEPKVKTGFWNDVALNSQRLIIERAGAKTLNAVGEELGEANESKVKYPFESAEVTDEDRRIRVGSDGSIVIPATATSRPTRSNGKVLFLASALGGKQLHYSRGGGDQDFEYTFDAPAAGVYALTMRVVTPSWKQRLHVSANDAKHPAVVELPHTVGAWETTAPVEVELMQGKNVIRLSRKGVKQEVEPKGFTVKDLTLTPAK